MAGPAASSATDDGHDTVEHEERPQVQTCQAPPTLDASSASVTGSLNHLLDHQSPRTYGPLLASWRRSPSATGQKGPEATAKPQTPPTPTESTSCRLVQKTRTAH